MTRAGLCVGRAHDSVIKDTFILLSRSLSAPLSGTDKDTEPGSDSDLVWARAHDSCRAPVRPPARPPRISGRRAPSPTHPSLSPSHGSGHCPKGWAGRSVFPRRAREGGGRRAAWGQPLPMAELWLPGPAHLNMHMGAKDACGLRQPDLELVKDGHVGSCDSRQ